jgi:GTP-sensing pleiotropic transcriptional regulator CodY
MPGDRKSVPDAAPARDPNLTFSFGEAFEKLIEEISTDPRKPGEFTSLEFGARLGKKKSQIQAILKRLVSEERVEVRKAGLKTYYRVKE